MHFLEDKELDIADIIGGSLPKLPLDVSLRGTFIQLTFKVTDYSLYKHVF